MTGRTLGHRAPLLWLVLPLIGGLAAGKAGFVPIRGGWLLAGACGAAAGAIWALGRAPRLWGPSIVTAMLLAGTASYELHRARLPAWDMLPPREARLTLRVDRVFAADDARKASGLAVVLRAEDHLRDLPGQRIYFSLALRTGERPPIRSTVVRAVGLLGTLPRNPPVDTFDGYLAGAGMNFRLTRGRVLTTERAPTSYYRFCARTAAAWRENLGRGIAAKRPSLAALLRAMMLGETHELTEEQHTLFLQSGTMHLFAISGLNIGVIATALQAIMLLLRLPSWVRFATGTVLLWLFVDITGAAPSAVRAFIMATFFQAAFVLQRPANPLAGVTASALVVLATTPLQLFSASFLMSYGIVVALLVLGLPLGEAWTARWTPWRDLPQVTWTWWQRRVDEAWRWGVPAVAIGLASTLVGIVTGLLFFRLITPWALVANLVLIPAAIAVTVGGFASLLCGIAGFGAGAALCNHAAALVLLAIEQLVRWNVLLPGAFIPARFAAPWVGVVALALLLVTLLGGYAANWRRERGGWWPPFAIVALVLIFGVEFGTSDRH